MTYPGSNQPWPEYGHQGPQPGQPYGQPPANYSQPQAGWAPGANSHPNPYGYPYGGNPYDPYRAGPPKRPGNILAAMIMAYVGSGFVILLGLLFLIGASSDGFVQGIGDGMDETSLAAARAAAYGIGAFALIEGLLVVLFAVFAHNGRNWARIVLTVLGGLNIAMSLASVASTPQSLVGAAYIATATVLLWVGEANPWYAARKAPQNHW